MDRELTEAITRVCDGRRMKKQTEECMLRIGVRTLEEFLAATEQGKIAKFCEDDEEFTEILRKLWICARQKKINAERLGREETQAGVARLVLEKLSELEREGKVSDEKREEYEGHERALKQQAEKEGK